jgi:Cys-tRNA(Pro)/Cys-tRNA(Cys) deacylase
MAHPRPREKRSEYRAPAVGCRSSVVEHPLGKGEVVSSILTGSTSAYHVTPSALTMSRTTRATEALAKTGIAFTVHAYHYDPNAESVGLQAAAALAEDPRRVLKTLMAEVDGEPVCVIVPADREVSMKKLAAAFGGKTARMMKPVDAERLTGYHVGGISPFGQKRTVPVALEQAALAETLVYINGGQRGLQVRLDPKDALRALQAIARPLIA